METLHFDQFLNEKDKAKLAVEIRGKQYEIPAVIPALVPLKMARAERIRDMRARNAEYTRLIFEAADALFGAEQLDEICTGDFTAQDLALLIQKCFECINGETETEDESEEHSDEEARTSLPGRTGKK